MKISLTDSPAHPDFVRVKLVVERDPFDFDPELFA